MLQVTCRGSEVHKQTRVPSIYGGAEIRDFARGGSAWRAGERGLPASRFSPISVLSLARREFSTRRTVGQLVARSGRRYCKHAGAEPLAPFGGARAGSHQRARRLLRSVSGPRHMQVRRGARDQTGGPGAPGRLVNDPRGTRVANALLAVRQESGGRRCRGQAEAAGRTEQSALEPTKHDVRLVGNICVGTNT